MQSHHFTSHDLDLLESYVHDCIQQLPKLPAATDAAVAGASIQIPTCCSSYHTVCTNMLKEIVTLLSLFSPRLCRLIGQVWDLASLNVFVLLQVANTALQDAQQLREQLVFIERFHAEGLERQASLTQRYEDEIARQRVSEQGLRAELQKVRQRANHLAVENGQLHLIVGRVLDAQQTMEAARFDSSNPAEQLASLESDGQRFCEDVAAVGDAEERELFGVGDGAEDALSRIQTVHPIESCATDFEQLFQALFEGEERNVRVLNEMDRFINSTAVALLWRYGSTEEEHQMMHRMLSASTVGTQTDGTVTEKPSHLSARSGDHWESDSDDFGSDDDNTSARVVAKKSQQELEDEDNQQYKKPAKHEVIAVTKHQVIPPTLRAQLDSRPRVNRVLDQCQLNRILLRLYLEKLECDARTLRRRRLVSARARTDSRTPDTSAKPIAVVRTPLHRFMKEFFVTRYEVPALADFHMMEVVKSCLYYHERLKIALRKGAVFASAALVGCLPGMPENLIQHMQHHNQHHQHGEAAIHDHPLQELFQQQQQFVAADVRVALFSQLCELVPFDTRGTVVDAAAIGGNLAACLLNAVVDVLGDALELDPAVRSIAEVEEVPNEASWGFPRPLALELLTRHLQFVDQPIIEDTKARIMRLAPLLRSTSVEDAIAADYISVDVFLALFATTWMKYDQCLENKLRESFRHQLLLSSPFARKQLDARLARTSVAVEGEGDTSQRDSEGPTGRPASRVSTWRATTVLPTVSVGATAIAVHSTPLELLTQAWMTLENETLSSLDVEELESTFRGLLEAKRLDGKHHRRQSLKRLPKDTQDAPVGAGVSLGGVTEKEFVFHALQVLRRRRNNFGLRTNSRRPPRFAVYGSPVHEDIGSVKTDEISIPLESLKPGLTTESLAYVGK
ncbi:hypothetical protein PHYSODRAFT_314505 [Phytophthora sojae]|uniref:Uncharacterized protein n=1 Tax=Phytophthora sojae (strain P6497) TaxID=1094619 RepID=G4ZE05_PHYSP|nr:hypothetical protein PHYSODRAFT_314505 [Phytophthora sojae]EGZ16926.1 hypothetical protein PHYSODRAFT_314505 [Phytophthora sojae]|eukprot:XP_009525984.1 hypothetical protein PHYSODRAFT_314505 [Phytophthora sojae]